MGTEKHHNSGRICLADVAKVRPFKDCTSLCLTCGSSSSPPDRHDPGRNHNRNHNSPNLMTGSWQATCRSLAKPNFQMSQLIAMSAMFGREGGGGWPVRRRGDKDTVRRSMACKKAWQKLPVPSCCCASESKGVWGQLAPFKCFCFRLCSRDMYEIFVRYLWDMICMFFLRCLQDMYGICLICMGFFLDIYETSMVLWDIYILLLGL